MYEKDDVYVITRSMKLLFFDTLKTPITPFCTKIKKDQRFQTINFTIWSGTSIMQILYTSRTANILTNNGGQ